MLLLYMQEIVPVDFLGGPFVLSRGGGQTRWLQAYSCVAVYAGSESLNLCSDDKRRSRFGTT